MLGRTMVEVLRTVQLLQARSLPIWLLDVDMHSNSEVGAQFGKVVGMFQRAEEERVFAVSRVAYLAARANGTKVGRSPVLTPEKWKEGGRLLRAGVSVREVAKRLGIATATAYNYRDAMMSDSVDDLEE